MHTDKTRIDLISLSGLLLNKVCERVSLCACETRQTDEQSGGKTVSIDR